MKNINSILIGVPDGKISLYKFVLKWILNQWLFGNIHVANNRIYWWDLLKIVMNFRIPWKVKYVLTSWVIIRFSRAEFVSFRNAPRNCTYAFKSNGYFTCWQQWRTNGIILYDILYSVRCGKRETDRDITNAEMIPHFHVGGVGAACFPCSPYAQLY